MGDNVAGNTNEEYDQYPDEDTGQEFFGWLH
jgi:hypothetical protein